MFCRTDPTKLISSTVTGVIRTISLFISSSLYALPAQVVRLLLEVDKSGIDRNGLNGYVTCY